MSVMCAPFETRPDREAAPAAAEASDRIPFGASEKLALGGWLDLGILVGPFALSPLLVLVYFLGGAALLPYLIPIPIVVFGVLLALVWRRG